MPYIKINAYPKDEETKKKVVDEINNVFLKYWGCPPQAITIGLDEVAPEDWEKVIREPLIEPDKEKMMILDGVKKYEL